MLSMELDGEVYSVGDDVYVAFDNYESEDEGDEECEVSISTQAALGGQTTAKAPTRS